MNELTFSAAQWHLSREEHVAYLDAALATGDPVYLVQALASLADALGVDEGEDELVALMRAAVVLGVKVGWLSHLANDNKPR